MPFEVIHREYYGGKWGNQLYKVMFLGITCDFCKKYKEVRIKPSAYIPLRVFCNKECKIAADKNGLLNSDRKITCQKKYGVNAPSQVPGASKKMIATRIINTGAACPCDKKSSSKEAYTVSMIENYGVEYSMQNDMLREKASITLNENHGVRATFQAGSKFRASKEIYEAAGVKGYLALYEKMRNKMLSKPEQYLFDFLVKKFGENDVLCQVPVDYGKHRPWLIDFYVASIDTYIAMDGVFWHGLDKPFEKLHERAKANYLKDRIMDEWFINSKKKLIRVTDLEFLAMKKKNDFSSLVSKLGG